MGYKAHPPKYLFDLEKFSKKTVGLSHLSSKLFKCPPTINQVIQDGPLSDGFCYIHNLSFQRWWTTFVQQCVYPSWCMQSFLDISLRCSSELTFLSPMLELLCLYQVTLIHIVRTNLYQRFGLTIFWYLIFSYGLDHTLVLVRVEDSKDSSFIFNRPAERLAGWNLSRLHPFYIPSTFRNWSQIYYS